MINTHTTSEEINSNCYSINEIILTTHKYDTTHTNQVKLITGQPQSNALDENILLPNPLKHYNIITSSAEGNCYRTVKLTNTKSQVRKKDRLRTLCDYTDIFLKHTAYIKHASLLLIKWKQCGDKILTSFIYKWSELLLQSSGSTAEQFRDKIN